MSETPVSQGSGDGQEVQGPSENVEETPVETSSETSENTDSINPAWNDLLEVVPSMLHSQVTPHLKKWDQNYQTGISKVHSQYEPYKQFVENKIDPGQLDYGYQLVQALENKPAEVIDALITFARENDIKLTSLEQQQLAEMAENSAEQGLDENDISAHPQVQQLMQQVEALKQQVEQSSEKEQLAAAEKQLEADVASLKEKYGEFDEEWVFTKCLNDPKGDLEAAVKAFKEFESSIAERVKSSVAPGAPQVLGPGGGNPTAGLEPPKTEADRKSRIKAILEGARQAEQG